MSSQVLDSGGSIKKPGVQYDMSDSISEYMKNFPYSIRVSLDKVYTDDFKEFHSWCVKNLGKKYKDWFLIGQPGRYTLYLKDTKKSMFLALKYSESIDKANL